MPNAAMTLANLRQQALTGLGGGVCAIAGGLGTITMTIITTSWDRGAVGVR